MTDKAEPQINDVKLYNERMSQSLIDKMFFFDKVEASVFVDYGCADGSLIRFFASLFPDHQFIGYDMNKDMIKAAESVDNPSNVEFTCDMSRVKMQINNWRLVNKKVCLLLSSVIHEVYSYGRGQVDEFWQEIWNLNADYVAIRDMCVSDTAMRPTDPICVARIHQIFSSEKINQWQSRWGSLDENWSFVHFLLTYQYEDNWEREYLENYLPLTKEALIRLIPVDYFPEFIEHYTLPYLRRKVERDLGIQLQERTHLKLIVRKI